jgi:hypothetical protein
MAMKTARANIRKRAHGRNDLESGEEETSQWANTGGSTSRIGSCERYLLHLPIFKSASLYTYM